jgi:hypothetical protein
MPQRRTKMGKLRNKNTLDTKTATLRVVPKAGWSWYCAYHDTAGSGDDMDEVQFMAGAHIHYHQIDGDVCELNYREHNERKEA